MAAAEQRRAERNEAIRRDKAGGMTWSALSEKYDLRPGRVQRILKPARSREYAREYHRHHRQRDGERRSAAEQNGGPS